MKKISVVASVLLLAFGLYYALSFVDRYSMGTIVQKELTLPVQTNSTDSSDFEYTNSKDNINLEFTDSVDLIQPGVKNKIGSDRFFKGSEPASMLFLGTGLLLFGRLGRTHKNN